MKRINLRGLQEKLSAKELKNVLGGSYPGYETGCCYQCNDIEMSGGVVNGATDIYTASGCFDFASEKCGGDEAPFICYPCGVDPWA